ncbi:hypothetical protein ABT124_01790 [Streptomyces sp. NPDC001982]|uniref:hypothetical protein n=1 Tax=Streptomyces sp. NPDC001982 TaxID=3154405 RepID=UPI003326C022
MPTAILPGAWNALKFGHPSSFVWSRLVTELALPGAACAGAYQSLDEEQNQVAVKALFRLIGDFLRVRDTERDGMRSIFRDYSLRFRE